MNASDNMIAVLDDEPVTSPPAATRPRPYLLLRILPWLLAAAGAYWMLQDQGTPPRQIGIYAAYFAVAVVLPGTLVLRALYGSRGNWPEDLGLGAATGLVVQLAGWALAAATGNKLLQPIWLGAIVLAFLVLPWLWKHWWIRKAVRQPLPVAWSWAIAVVLGLVVVWAAGIYRTIPLPPATVIYYQDIYYHLSLVHEMTRSMPFQVPQLAGETLRYHYLSDADMAAASQLTGIDPVTIYLRLWLVPIVGVVVFVMAALARTVSGRWWAGPAAGAAAVVGVGLTLRGPVDPFYSIMPVTLNSPSQTYALPLLGLFTIIAVEALRGRKLRWWTWAALPLLAVACAGAKSSALPPLFAGIALAAFVLACRRRMPWTALGLLAVIGSGIAVGLRIFAGAGAGTLQAQPLGLLRWMTPYTDTYGLFDGVSYGGILPPGVAGADTAGRWFVAWLVVWWFLMQAPRFLGLLVPLRRREPRRDDVTYWLLGGMLVAGTLAAWLFWHPSASQAYFFDAVIPIGSVLLVCSLADRVGRLRFALAAALAGASWVLFMPRTRAPKVETPDNWAWALAQPLLLTLAVTAGVALLTLAIWRGRAARALPAALMAAVVGGGLATGINGFVSSLDSPGREPNPARVVTADEMSAAFWLDDHAAPDDVVATNVHCLPISAVRVCDSRAFWVASLTGRRALVESWGYSDAAFAANGVDDQKYFFQPAPDQALFELNQRAFTDASKADIQQLKTKHHVRWLFADSRAGKVSPALRLVATLRHSQGPVNIYELR